MPGNANSVNVNGKRPAVLRDVLSTGHQIDQFRWKRCQEGYIFLPGATRRSRARARGRTLTNRARHQLEASPCASALNASAPQTQAP
jgi:hypothetical protein